MALLSESRWLGSGVSKLKLDDSEELTEAASIHLSLMPACLGPDMLSRRLNQHVYRGLPVYDLDDPTPAAFPSWVGSSQ